MHTSCRALPCALAFNRLSLHPLGTAPVSPGQMGSREMAQARKAAGSPQAAQTGARGLELPACPDPCGSPATRGHSAPPLLGGFRPGATFPHISSTPAGCGQGRAPGALGTGEVGAVPALSKHLFLRGTGWEPDTTPRGSELEARARRWRPVRPPRPECPAPRRARCHSQVGRQVGPAIAAGRWGRGRSPAAPACPAPPPMERRPALAGLGRRWVLPAGR